MQDFSFVSFLVCGLVFLSTVTCDPTQATLPCGGMAQGMRGGHDTFQWMGIRYAQAPVNDLRWKHAASLQPSDCYWSGTLQATTEGDACMQQWPLTLNKSQSEDCLYLNVIAPSGWNPQSVPLLPVVFWIHGGSNVAGWNSIYANLSAIAASSNAVIVAVNYRLGSLGYLALRELSENSATGTSGNYGISDLLVALSWTQRNVASFGGDATRVTLMGQSSGGTNIFALLANAATTQTAIFWNALSLSGSANLSMTLPTAEALNRKYALATSPCANASDVYACLMGLSSAEANILCGPAYNTDVFSPCSVFGCSSPQNPVPYLPLPIVDGYLLQYGALDAMAKLPSAVSGINVVFQSLQGEEYFFPNPDVNDSWTPRQFSAYMRKTYVEERKYDAKKFDSLFAVYASDASLKTPREKYSVMTTDSGTTFGQTNLRLNRRSANSNTYVGYVVCRPEFPFPVLAGAGAATIAFHMWDYIAATGSFAQASRFIPGTQPYTPGPRDLAYGEQLRIMWANFFAFGVMPWSNVAGDTGVIDCTTVTSEAQYRHATEQQWRDIVEGRLESFWWIN